MEDTDNLNESPAVINSAQNLSSQKQNYVATTTTTYKHNMETQNQTNNQQIKTTTEIDPKGNAPDYSTLGRLRKNIKELGDMIDVMDQEEADVLNKRYVVQSSSSSSSKLQGNTTSYSEGNLNTCTDLALVDDCKQRVRLNFTFGNPDLFSFDIPHASF